MEGPFCTLSPFAHQEVISIKKVSSLDIIEPNHTINSEFSLTQSSEQFTFNDRSSCEDLLALTEVAKSKESAGPSPILQRDRVVVGQGAGRCKGNNGVDTAAPSIEYIMLQCIRNEQLRATKSKFTTNFNDIFNHAPQFSSQELQSSSESQIEQPVNGFDINCNEGAAASLGTACFTGVEAFDSLPRPTLSQELLTKELCSLMKTSLSEKRKEVRQKNKRLEQILSLLSQCQVKPRHQWQASVPKVDGVLLRECFLDFWHPSA